MNQNTKEQKLIKKRKRDDIKNVNDSVEDIKGEISNNSGNENNSFETNEKKDEKDNVLSLKDNNNNSINEYMYSVFIPFVESSYKFFKNKSMINFK